MLAIFITIISKQKNPQEITIRPSRHYCLYWSVAGKAFFWPSPAPPRALRTPRWPSWSRCCCCRGILSCEIAAVHWTHPRTCFCAVCKEKKKDDIILYIQIIILIPKSCHATCHFIHTFICFTINRIWNLCLIIIRNLILLMTVN